MFIFEIIAQNACSILQVPSIFSPHYASLWMLSSFTFHQQLSSLQIPNANALSFQHIDPASVLTRSTNYTNRKVISTLSVSLRASYFTFHFISFYISLHMPVAETPLPVWSQFSVQRLYTRTISTKNLLMLPTGISTRYHYHLTFSVSPYFEFTLTFLDLISHFHLILWIHSEFLDQLFWISKGQNLCPKLGPFLVKTGWWNASSGSGI